MEANDLIIDALKELNTSIQLSDSLEQRQAILAHARRLLSVLVEVSSIPQEILEQWDHIKV